MACAVQVVTHWYGFVARSLDRARPAFLLLLRLYIGWQFFKTGRGKLENIDSTAEFFEGIGIPAPTWNAYAAGATECFGGLLLLVGAAARLAAVPLIATMLVAYATAHAEELHSLWGDPNRFLKAPPFLFLLTAIIVLLFGPGPLSVDGLLRRYFVRSPQPHAGARAPERMDL